MMDLSLRELAIVLMSVGFTGLVFIAEYYLRDRM